MYGYDWVCMAMGGYVWLRAGYVWLWVGFEEPGPGGIVRLTGCSLCCVQHCLETARSPKVLVRMRRNRVRRNLPSNTRRLKFRRIEKSQDGRQFQKGRGCQQNPDLKQAFYVRFYSFCIHSDHST